MIFAFKFFVSLLFLYGVMCFYMYITQEAKIFNHSMVPDFPAPKGEAIHAVALKVDEYALLRGLHVKHDAKTLLIYFGGNADDAVQFVTHVPTLKSVDIVMFNYRGYGHSTGIPSQKTLYADTLRIYDTYAPSYEKVILVGRSLGTAMTAYLSAHREAALTVLITPFDSIASIAKENYPWLPVEWLIKHPFPSDKYISKVKHPVSIMEVENDTTTPRIHLEKIKAKILNLEEHYVFKNTTHGKVLEHPNFERVLHKMIEKFI